MGLIVKLRLENMTPENHIKRPFGGKIGFLVLMSSVGPQHKGQPQPIEGEIDIITLVNPCSCPQRCVFSAPIRAFVSLEAR